MEHRPVQRKRPSPIVNIISIVLVAVLFFLIWNNVAGGSGPTRMQPNEFVTYIGYRGAPDAEGRYFDLGRNRVHAVAQQGGNFFILLRPMNADGVISAPSAEAVEAFERNPSRNASRRMMHSHPGLIADIILRQTVEANRINNENTAWNTANPTELQRPTFHAIQTPHISVSGSVMDWLFPVLSLLLLAGLIFLIWRGMSGRNSVLGMGRNRATVVMSSPIRFSDVAGVEEERAEVEEIIQFLRSPRKFLELGARIPKGFLLVGAPGTGKTLLAKAIAGEAGVPFFSISGSDFSEMLVGVGPSRMRDLFEQAKANTPCIIFIDEIDSIAKMRGIGASSAAEENEQTLNQLLVQMDGFTKSEGVIVLAATNRPDVLDQALLRPGRFDRQIVVQMPDVSGREKILKVHSKNKPISSDVDLKRVSQIISGFTGADIENLMNESAIIAAKKNRKKITMNDITEGINKVLLGPQKRSRIITDEDKKITAYHEAGHAVLSYILQPKQTVQEVSIIPRGMAAGYTLMNDNDDVTAHRSKSFLKTQLAVYMGGRAAEAMFIGDICTGAQQDLKQATGLAERMVTSFGMSEKLGPLYYGRSDEFILRGMDKNVSDNMQEIIDGEIRALMNEAQSKATEILNKYKKQVDVMVEILLERETIYADDVKLIMEGATKKDVIAQIEQRLATAKKQDDADRIEGELELLDMEFKRVGEMAQTFYNAKIISEQSLHKLHENFELAREILRSGGHLRAIPTLDNIDQYATIIGTETKQEAKETSTEPGAIDPAPRQKKSTTKKVKETTNNDESPKVD